MTGSFRRLLRNLRLASEMKKKPKPKPKRGRPATGQDPTMSLRVPADLRKRIDAAACRDGQSTSEWIRSQVERRLVEGGY